MQPLYELAGQYKALAERLHDLDLDEQTIADTLEGESGELIEKGTNVAKVLRSLESMAAQIKEAEASMAARRKALERRAEWLKGYLHRNMEACGISKIESPWFCISLKKNPPAVVVADEASIPPDFLREIPARHEPDKGLIKQALRDGFEVPGCYLQSGTRLEIK